MSLEARVWEIDKDDNLTECKRQKLDLETRLEQWLAHDISMLSPDLLVIGKQVQTAFGGIIDLNRPGFSGDILTGYRPPWPVLPPAADDISSRTRSEGCCRSAREVSPC